MAVRVVPSAQLAAYVRGLSETPARPLPDGLRRLRDAAGDDEEVHALSGADLRFLADLIRRVRRPFFLLWLPSACRHGLGVPGGAADGLPAPTGARQSAGTADAAGAGAARPRTGTARPAVAQGAGAAPVPAHGRQRGRLQQETRRRRRVLRRSKSVPPNPFGISCTLSKKTNIQLAWFEHRQNWNPLVLT